LTLSKLFKAFLNCANEPGPKNNQYKKYFDPPKF